MKKMIGLAAVLAIGVAVLGGIGCAEISGKAKEKLVVVVVVDQMRADYLDRYAGWFKDGFARLLKNGKRYTNAHQDHALTVTAAGHATIATGAFPSNHGIVGNDWYERTEQRKVYCSDDSSSGVLGFPDMAGRSPARMQRTALGDWLKAVSPNSKVFAISRKDRPAIMMGGKQPDGVYWYNSRNGQFVTSEYYVQAYPAWVDSFNALKLADRYLEQGWKKSAAEETYFVSREDEFMAEFDGIHTTFPHEFPSETGKPNRRYYSALTTSPFADELVFEFAKAAVKHEELGKDGAPDLLFLGCSAADAIGHAFGPLSQEAQDHFMRLDQYLGDFMRFLDETVGERNYIMVLSADHGALPLPEELKRRGYDARRISYRDMMTATGKAAGKIARQFGIRGNLILTFANGIVLNEALIQKSGANVAEVEAALANALKALPYIEDVFTRSELMQSNGVNDRPFLENFRRSFHPDRSPNLMLRFKPHYLLTSRAQGTSHGSPYPYDTHVPLIFYGKRIPQETITDFVRTADIAPTLAGWLGIQPPAEVDGNVLF